MSRAKKLGVAIVVIVVLGFSGLVCHRVGERGRFSVAYSSYGAGPDGARGLFLLAKELGASPVRWTEDIVRLPDGGMLVVLGGCELLGGRPLGDFEHERLVEWVEGGGTVVVAGASRLLRKQDGVWLHRDPAQCDPERGIMGAIARAAREARARRDGGTDAGPAPADVDAGPPERPDAGAPEREHAWPPPGDRADGGPAAFEPVGPGERPLGPDEPAPGGGFGGPDAGPPPSFDDLGERFVEDPAGTVDELGEADPEPEPVATEPVDEPLLGMGEVPMTVPADVRVADDVQPEARTVLEVAGEPAGVVLDRGRGRIVALASASMLQNEALAAARGGVLFARLLREYAPEGPVYFDEYHLGLGSRRSLVQYVRQLGGGPLVLQVLFLLALLWWRMGARFGTPRRAAAAAPGGTASYVTAVGELYRRAAEPEGAAGVLVRRALSRVAEHHHLRHGDARTLAAALDERGRQDEARAVRRLGELAEEPVGKRQGLVARAREIDRALAEAIPEQGPGDRSTTRGSD